MSDKDYLFALLQLGSALELSLMKLYLYAAYSLGGGGVSDKSQQKRVEMWRETLLNVAREEMGHLLTVQNLLTFIGAPVDFSHTNFPWPIAWFDLEPLSLDSLACYILAEMPEKLPESEPFPEKREVEERAEKHLIGRKLTHVSGNTGRLGPLAKEDLYKSIPHLHQVGEVYRKIIDLTSDSEKIPESMLRPETYLSQSSWDEWGRGYRQDPKPLDPEGNLIDALPARDTPERYGAIVMVDRVATRTQALKALEALSVQGEGPHGSEEEDEPSHFERFLAIYREWKEIASDKGFNPTRNIPRNPATVARDDKDAALITHPRSRRWAALFNLRYRMLLTYLMHTFRFERATDQTQPNLRSMLMHRIFTEMYNLKAIARILVELPISQDAGPDGLRAGPPFERPFSHNLPADPEDCWKLHLNTLDRAEKIVADLLPVEKDQGSNGFEAYLLALRDVDRQTARWVNGIQKGFEAARGAAV